MAKQNKREEIAENLISSIEASINREQIEKYLKTKTKHGQTFLQLLANEETDESIKSHVVKLLVQK